MRVHETADSQLQISTVSQQTGFKIPEIRIYPM